MFGKLFRKTKSLFARLRRDKKGAALVEYALLVAGIALIGAAAVSLIGHKTGDMLGTMAVILPGAHTDDNAPIMSGHMIETSTVGPGGSIAIDYATILKNTGTSRLDSNVFGNAAELGLVLESN